MQQLNSQGVETVEPPVGSDEWIDREALALVERIESAVLERLKAEAES